MCFVCLFLFFSYKCHSKKCKIHLLSAQLLSREDKLNISQHFWGPILLAITNLSLIKIYSAYQYYFCSEQMHYLFYPSFTRGEKQQHSWGKIVMHRLVQASSFSPVSRLDNLRQPQHICIVFQTVKVSFGVLFLNEALHVLVQSIQKYFIFFQSS